MVILSVPAWLVCACPCDPREHSRLLPSHVATQRRPPCRFLGWVRGVWWSCWLVIGLPFGPPLLPRYWSSVAASVVPLGTCAAARASPDHRHCFATTWFPAVAMGGPLLYSHSALAAVSLATYRHNLRRVAAHAREPVARLVIVTSG